MILHVQNFVSALTVVSAILFAPQFSLAKESAKETTSELQASKSVNAEATNAFADLKKGNERFISGKVRSDGQSRADITRLATSQAPHAIVLSCSDSRVPPEAVFDQKLGEIFAVRSAGETLSPQAVASMEFAIEKLKSHLVVVLGHTNCGAVKAAVETISGKSAGSPNLDKLVQDIHPYLKSHVGKDGPSKDLKEESWANARGISQDLLKRSEIISKAVGDGRVVIKVGLYNLTDGTVEFE